MPEPQRPHAAHLRLGRISLPGQVYVLTMVTRNRQSVFRDFACARTVVRVLREHDRRGVARTLCFVVMPDHVHWMMELGTVCDLGEAVRTLKSLVSRRIGRPVFQKGFYDHAVRDDEDLRTLARYLVANPVRAGLVERVNDYPHWDAVWLDGE